MEDKYKRSRLEMENSLTAKGAKAYYAKNYTPQKIFYEVPRDLEAYTVREFTFIIEKENGEWKFSQFGVFY